MLKSTLTKPILQMMAAPNRAAKHWKEAMNRFTVL